MHIVLHYLDYRITNSDYDLIHCIYLVIGIGLCISAALYRLSEHMLNLVSVHPYSSVSSECMVIP